MVSQVETALQVASGTKYPRVCWGCGAAGHTYGKECPKYNDPSAAKAYIQEMQKFLERRRNNKRGHYGPKGFLTRHIQDAVSTIASEATTPFVRETLLSQVADQIHTFYATRTEPNKTQKTESDLNGTTFVSYFSAHTFESHPQVEFAINKLQPFMYFPIGLSSDNHANLRGLYDTGGCCNMGWLPYHLDTAKRFPDIVKQVINLENIREEPFNIGGIDGSVLITHIIKYYLPYKNGQGENFTLQIGRRY